MVCFVSVTAKFDLYFTLFGVCVRKTDSNGTSMIILGELRIHIINPKSTQGFHKID